MLPHTHPLFHSYFGCRFKHTLQNIMHTTKLDEYSRIKYSSFVLWNNESHVSNWIETQSPASSSIQRTSLLPVIPLLLFFGNSAFCQKLLKYILY